jgi:peptidyl-prolyl cis-trans isomerase B (cyclophilin B)
MAQSHPIVTFTLENGGQFKAELYPEQAPNTVNNFISLIQKKFYDGLIFHRVIPGFMIQGGCPEGTGTGGPGYRIRQEFLRDPADRRSYFKHSRGVLSMARSQHPDSAGSQFFVMVADSPHLDGQYTSFGKVFEGLDVVDSIVGQPRDGNDRPKTPQRIKTVTVDTQGAKCAAPETFGK